MKFPRRRFLHLAAGAAALSAASRIARAQPYSARPVRIVVGSGGSGHEAMKFLPPAVRNRLLRRALSFRLEQLAGDMGRASDARRRHVEFTGIGPGVGDELWNCIGRHRWVHHQDVGEPDNARDRRDVAGEMETQLVEQRRVDRVEETDHEQHVAVRRCVHDRLGGNIASRAWLVLNDKRLAKPLREPLTHETHGDIGRATSPPLAKDQAWKPARLRLALKPMLSHRSLCWGRGRASAGGSVR